MCDRANKVQLNHLYYGTYTNPLRKTPNHKRNPNNNNNNPNKTTTKPPQNKPTNKKKKHKKPPKKIPLAKKEIPFRKSDELPTFKIILLEELHYNIHISTTGVCSLCVWRRGSCWCP